MRRGLLVLVLLLAIAGCTFGPPGGDAAISAQAVGQATDPASAERCGEVRGDVRLVPHALGTAEVPMAPERVVVLDTGELDAAKTVGITPVGVVELGYNMTLPANLAGAAEGAERIGTIAQPNLEAIAALEPDLILGNMVRDERIASELARIAPTVLAADIGPMWRDNLRLYATALGRCEAADAALAAYDAAVADLRADLGGDDLEVSVVRALFDRVRIYGQASFIGSILADAGLARPPAQRFDDLMEEVGIERLDDLDGDVMFISRWGPLQPALDTLAGSPLWSGLGAVSAGRVHEVDDATWMLSIGVTGARDVVDDLRAHLVTPDLPGG